MKPCDAGSGDETPVMPLVVAVHLCSACVDCGAVVGRGGGRERGREGARMKVYLCRARVECGAVTLRWVAGRERGKEGRGGEGGGVVRMGCEARGVGRERERARERESRHTGFKRNVHRRDKKSPPPPPARPSHIEGRAAGHGNTTGRACGQIREGAAGSQLVGPFWSSICSPARLGGGGGAAAC